jgi:hypothetical protein
MVFARDAYEVSSHSEGFDVKEWREMLRRGELVYVKVGGAWRYTRGDDALALSNTFVHSDELRENRRKVSEILGRNRWVPDETLSSYLSMSSQEASDLIQNLIERCAISRAPPELEEELGNGLAPIEGIGNKDFDDMIVRYLYGVPSSTSDLASAFGMGADEARDHVERLRLANKIRKIKVLTMDGGAREVWTTGEYEEEGSKITRILHPEDIYLRSSGWKGDGYALVHGSNVVGTLDLWPHDDHFAITDVRCDDLGQFFEALRRMMAFYRLMGVEAVRIDAHRSTEWKGSDPFPKDDYALDGGRLYYGMRRLDATEENAIAYIIERQRVNALVSPEEMLQELHGIRSIFELGLRMTGSRRYDPASRFPKLYEGFDASGTKVFSRMGEFAIYHAARKGAHLTRHENYVLNLIRSRPGVLEGELYDIAGLGEGTFKQSIERLESEDYIVRGWKGRIYPVPDHHISRGDARSIVVRWLMHEFGLFSLSKMTAYLSGEYKKEELLSILNGLVGEGCVERFCIENDVHYVLSSDPERMMKKVKDEVVDFMKDALHIPHVHVDQRVKLPKKTHRGLLVITPDDRIFSYLAPTIKKRFKLKRCWLVIKDGAMVGVFRARLTRSQLRISEVRGGRDSARAINAFARQWGFRMMGRIEDRTYEVQDEEDR